MGAILARWRTVPVSHLRSQSKSDISRNPSHRGFSGKVGIRTIGWLARTATRIPQQRRLITPRTTAWSGKQSFLHYGDT